ncbi:hypothetical protein ACKFKF_13720 [Phormidesmis sp. 146-12]
MTAQNNCKRHQQTEDEPTERLSIHDFLRLIDYYPNHYLLLTKLIRNFDTLTKESYLGVMTPVYDRIPQLHP